MIIMMTQWSHQAAPMRFKHVGVLSMWCFGALYEYFTLWAQSKCRLLIFYWFTLLFVKESGYIPQSFESARGNE